MTRYSVQPRDLIFVKGYGFLSFAKKLVKYIDEYLNKCLSGKYSQKRFDQAKQSATDASKTSSERVVQKTAEATSDLIGNERANKITKL